MSLNMTFVSVVAEVEVVQLGAAFAIDPQKEPLSSPKRADC